MRIKLGNDTEAKKYYVHRVMYQAYYGVDPDSLDVSHLLFCGKTQTAKNINPRFLAAESNDINQGRKLCFQFMDLKAKEFYGLYKSQLRHRRLPGDDLSLELEDNMVGWWDSNVRQKNHACLMIHGGSCEASFTEWEREYQAELLAIPSSSPSNIFPYAGEWKTPDFPGDELGELDLDD